MVNTEILSLVFILWSEISDEKLSVLSAIRKSWKSKGSKLHSFKAIWENVPAIDSSIRSAFTFRVTLKNVKTIWSVSCVLTSHIQVHTRYIKVKLVLWQQRKKKEHADKLGLFIFHENYVFVQRSWKPNWILHLCRRTATCSIHLSRIIKQSRWLVFFPWKNILD